MQTQPAWKPYRNVSLGELHNQISLLLPELILAEPDTLKLYTKAHGAKVICPLPLRGLYALNTVDRLQI